MRRRDARRAGPWQESGPQRMFATTTTSAPSLPHHLLTPADAEAWLQSHKGHLLVEVEVGNNGHTRTYRYASLKPAERCVERALARGASARVALVQTLPVGIVVGGGL